MKEPHRGATLEVIISRMKTVSSESVNKIRIVAVSATVPNLVDIADWLKDSNGAPAEMRFRKLTTEFLVTSIGQ